MVLDFLFGKVKQAETPQQMGYNTSPGLEYLKQYSMANKNVFSNIDDINDYSNTLTEALRAGNLDQNTAMAMFNSRVSPNNADALRSDGFKDILNYKIGPIDAKNSIQNTLAPMLSRFGDEDEVNYLYDAADAAGVLNNPNELRQFTSQYIAMTPEGRQKDMTPYYANQASYGPTLTDEDGYYIGQDVFLGDKKKYKAVDDTINATNSLVANTLAKMGAKGTFT